MMMVEHTARSKQFVLLHLLLLLAVAVAVVVHTSTDIADSVGRVVEGRLGDEDGSSSIIDR